MLATAGLAVGVFASTNIDDIFLLLGFFADKRFRPWHVVAGQFLGIGSLFVASAIASLASLFVAPAVIGLLGFAPIAIGLKKLWGLRRAEEVDELSQSSSHGNIMTVASVTAANGGDNISIYTPLFAIRSPSDVAVMGVVFAAMTGVWLVAAHWLTRHRQLGAPIRKYSHRVVPFVLIALGCYILVEARSYSLLR